MRLTTVILIASLMQVSAAGFAQKISLSQSNASLKTIFREIKAQSGYNFLYTENLLKNAKPVSIDVKDADVLDVLKQVFKEQPLTYKIYGSTAVITEKAIAHVLKKEDTFTHLANILNGKVNDSRGKPLVGVSVTVKGTNVRTSTDDSGEYSIDAPASSTLVFSYVGFETRDIMVSGRSVINVVMEESVSSLDQVMVVGYGTQRKRDLTVAISQVKGAEIQSIPKTSFIEALGGRAAGVDVVSASGAPGAKSTIRIRGANSVNSNADPLYVIDGFPIAASMGNLFETSRLGISGEATDLMSMINPNDIESIEFLKDAAATSIYGARGANGVVLITTKTGRQGVNDISVNINTGVQAIAKRWDMMDATEYSKLLYDAYTRGGINMNSLAFDPAEKLAIPITYNTNWLNEILRSGSIQDYTVSFTGATENSNFSGSAGYLKNDGIIKSNQFERYTARLNAESKAWKGKLKFGLNANMSYVDQKSISTDGVYNNAMRMAPNYPVRFPEGTSYAGSYVHTDITPAWDLLWGTSYVAASSASLNSFSPDYVFYLIKAPTNQARMIVNSFVSAELIDGLVFKTSVGTDLNYSKMKYLAQSYGPFRPTGGSLEHKQDQTYSWLIENTLTYTKRIKDHFITGLLGQSGQKFYSEGLGFAAEEFSAGNVFVSNNPFFVDGWYFNNGVQDRLTDTHKYAKVGSWTMASYFARLNYSYQNKYMVTATLRKDGSSRFGKDSKWGMFPGVSAAWNIDQESFFKVGFMDQLKVRGSWGVVGNGNISSYQSQALLTSLPSTLIGVIVAGTSTYESGLVDPSLAWESTKEFDFGFDAKLFNRVNITSDIYWKQTYDLLYGFSLPQSTGFDGIATTNLGSLRQFGFEVSIAGDIIQAKQKNGFNWFGSLNLEHLRGRITELPPNVQWVGNNIRSYLNKPIGSIFGYQVDGIYNTLEEVNAPSNPYKSAQVGDYKYRDLGGTDAFGNFVNAPDGNITAADRTDLGNVNPVISFGFSNTFTYKSIDLTIFLRSSIGNKIYNQTKRNLLNANGNNNTIREALNRWTPENHSQTIQAANSNRKDPTGSVPINTFVEDGSYLRLANLTFGYAFPEKLNNKLGIKSLRFYGTANNLFVLTGYSGLDPEVQGGDALVPRGIDDSVYPKTRVFSVGLNAKF